MARNTKLTPTIQQRIVHALNSHATHKIACDYAGIVLSTFYAWLERGRGGRQPYKEFLEAVTRASAMAAVQSLALIAQAAQQDWRAAAWQLERRYPQEYGRQVLDVSGQIDVHVQDARQALASALDDIARRIPPAANDDLHEEDRA